MLRFPPKEIYFKARKQRVMYNKKKLNNISKQFLEIRREWMNQEWNRTRIIPYKENNDHGILIPFEHGQIAIGNVVVLLKTLNP